MHYTYICIDIVLVPRLNMDTSNMTKKELRLRVKYMAEEIEKLQQVCRDVKKAVME
ncbi:unnamed protein product [marine sediment metagenome]|uniref:Uncharacterized protein n=1 Tax=marine sediment metagenome TaxID=412755 RepID=X0ZI68_9ZZZZ